jgi:hypothetical protein
LEEAFVLAELVPCLYHPGVIIYDHGHLDHHGEELGHLDCRVSVEHLVLVDVDHAVKGGLRVEMVDLAEESVVRVVNGDDG